MVRNKCLAALFLFASWPVVNFANVNKEQVFPYGSGFLGVSLVVLIGVSIGTFFLLRRILPRGRDVGIAIAIAAGLVIFFGYSLLHDAWTRFGLLRGFSYLYLVVLIGVPLSLLLTYRSREGASVLFVMALAATAWPVGGVAWFLVTKVRAELPTSEEAIVGRLADKPNVYYIISDGYPRLDQLSKAFDYDNTQFLDDLRSRGFFVADYARANYPMTFMSLTSSLLMDYLATEESAPFDSRESFYRIIQGQNPVVKGLKSNGYKYVHLGSVKWNGSRCGRKADVCLSSSTEIENALVSLTPIERFLQGRAPISYLFRGREVATIADIRERVESLEERAPYVLFAHTWPPHPPQTFHSDCSLRTDSPGISKEEIRSLYLQDIKCVNKQLTELLSVLEVRDPEAIVVWQSDHGTDFVVDWAVPIEEWTREAFLERFGIMLAIKMPARCGNLFYPSITPVNVFRVVFACMERKEVRLLQDKSYVSAYEGHEQFGLSRLYDY